jgi:isoquinoline 1-oxidoreductase beta subunit
VKSFDAGKVQGMRGVQQVVPVGDTGVAVVADTFWNAKTAVAALPIVWGDGPNAAVSSASIADMLKEGLDAPKPLSATKRAMRRPPLLAPPKRWRRSTATLTRITRRWSR